MLIREHAWLIAAQPRSDDFNTYILENVGRYEIEGHWADNFHRPVFISME